MCTCNHRKYRSLSLYTIAVAMGEQVKECPSWKAKKVLYNKAIRARHKKDQMSSVMNLKQPTREVIEDTTDTMRCTKM